MANPDDTNPLNPSPLNESAKAAVAKLDLQSVESPSISPAYLVAPPAIAAAPAAPPASAAPVAEAPPAAAPVAAVTPAAWPSPTFFTLKPRQKRQALMAASVAIAGAVGVVTGAAVSRAVTPPSSTTADDRQIMEQTVARLTKEVTALKIGLEAANKTAHAQIAKISERTDRMERAASADLVTGSISAPQTVPAAAVPVPTPRPAPRIAAVEAAPPARPAIVQDWAIREARDGYVYVQGHGDVYQVVPGAPLPGLGPVESIKQKDGRWVVTTPKGIIISMRDRRYFE